MSANIPRWQALCAFSDAKFMTRRAREAIANEIECLRTYIADLRAELARRDAVVSEEKFVRAAAETGVFCTMPQAVAFGHAVQPFRKVVAWRRATKHTWEYRTNAPTASTRGDGWMPLLDGDGPDAAVVSEGQAVAVPITPTKEMLQALADNCYSPKSGYAALLAARPAAPAPEAPDTPHNKDKS